MTSDLTGLEEMMNEQNPLAVQVQHRKFSKSDNKAVDAVAQAPGTYTTTVDGRVAQVQIKSVIAPGYKTLPEARGLATSDYQNYLEKQWIQELRAKYPVKTNATEVTRVTAMEKK